MKREGLATHTRGRHEQHGSPQEWRERRRGRGKFDLKLEVVLIPVSDVDRSKKFYEDLGWTLDADFGVGEAFRIVQFTPPGSGCSTGFGKGVTPAAPGSAKGLELIVSDIVAVRAELAERGLDVSEVFHGSPFSSGGRISGPDPERGSYKSYASFEDPDGNLWLLQEVTVRLPGRIDSAQSTSCPWRIWPARCGVPRLPTASMRSEPASTTRTGPTGTPSTWCVSRRARNSRRERLRRDRPRRRVRVRSQ